MSLQEFEQNLKTVAFSQHEKVCDVLKLVSSVEEAALFFFFPPSLPRLSFLDLVLERVYIVMISCWVLRV